MDTDPPKYPPLTQAALVNYNHLNPFSEVVPAEKMAELEQCLIDSNAMLKRTQDNLRSLLAKFSLQS